MDIFKFFNNTTHDTSIKYSFYNSTSTYAVPLSTLFMLTNYRHYFLYTSYVMFFIGTYETLIRYYKNLLPLYLVIFLFFYHYFPLYIYYYSNYYYNIDKCFSYKKKSFQPLKSCFKKQKKFNKVKWRDIETNYNLTDDTKYINTSQAYLDYDYNEKIQSFIFGMLFFCFTSIFYLKNDNWPYIISLKDMLLMNVFIFVYFFYI